MYRLIANENRELADLLTTTNEDTWNKLKASDTLDKAADVLKCPGNLSRAMQFMSEVNRIKWWTDHMSGLAKCVEEFQSEGDNIDPNSASFSKLRAALNDEAKSVGTLSDDYFSLPWGILAVSQVLGFVPKAEAKFVSNVYTLPAVDSQRAAPKNSGGRLATEHEHTASRVWRTVCSAL